MAAPKLGILGTGAPSTVTAIYSVPSARQAVISTLTIAETGGADATVSIYAVVSGGTPIPSNALAVGLAVKANTHVGITEGITLGPSQKLYATSSTGNVTFCVFGEETDVPSA